MKKYPVSEAEVFGLQRIHERLNLLECIAKENGLKDDADNFRQKILDIESLMFSANKVGDLVNLPQIKKIRKLCDEYSTVNYPR